MGTSTERRGIATARGAIAAAVALVRAMSIWPGQIVWVLDASKISRDGATASFYLSEQQSDCRPTSQIEVTSDASIELTALGLVCHRPIELPHEVISDIAAILLRPQGDVGTEHYTSEKQTRVSRSRGHPHRSSDE